jgi:hypothetical protein
MIAIPPTSPNWRNKTLVWLDITKFEKNKNNKIKSLVTKTQEKKKKTPPT